MLSMGAAQMHPETCTGTTLLWNYEETMRFIQGAGNVAACLAGHTHKVRRWRAALHFASRWRVQDHSGNPNKVSNPDHKSLESFPLGLTARRLFRFRSVNP